MSELGLLIVFVGILAAIGVAALALRYVAEGVAAAITSAVQTMVAPLPRIGPPITPGNGLPDLFAPPFDQFMPDGATQDLTLPHEELLHRTDEAP